MSHFLKSLNKVFIASDHAGWDLKARVLRELKLPCPLEDLGPNSGESVDYPQFAQILCEKLRQDSSTAGILICGSGQGMAMTANKFSFVRAALCWNLESAELSRAHNNANVLCLGARLLPGDLALEITRKFFSTEFEGGRHQRRVDMIRC